MRYDGHRLPLVRRGFGYCIKWSMRIAQGFPGFTIAANLLVERIVILLGPKYGLPKNIMTGSKVTISLAIVNWIIFYRLVFEDSQL